MSHDDISLYRQISRNVSQTLTPHRKIHTPFLVYYNRTTVGTIDIKLYNELLTYKILV